MRTEGIVFLFIGFWALLNDVVYWYWSKDVTGTACLALTFGLGLLIGFYLVFHAKRMSPRPEDRPDAEIAEGAGELGHFSPHSIWPILIAFSIAIAVIGILYGAWLAVLGVFCVVLSVGGLLFEYFKRPHIPFLERTEH